MGALEPGQLLDGTPYRVVRELGAGGMGVVYEVEHVRLGKQYVAKVMNDAGRSEPGAAERMEREAKVLARFAHPNVVQVHDVGSTADGAPYLVMEKLIGRDLRKAMNAGKVDRARAVAILRDVLGAVDYVHRRGVIHRDIKPANVFLAEEATGTITKLLDFGIVHVFGESASAHPPLTATGSFVGTLRYAAPEQLEGKPIGPAADVYAVGLLLFELLAGRGPFDHDDGVGLARCLGPAPRLSAFKPVPPAIDALLARVLDRDPAVRPTAIVFAAELATLAVTGSSGDPESRVEADVDRAVRADIDDLLRHLPPVRR
jgi:serine/threonine-protein kinase